MRGSRPRSAAAALVAGLALIAAGCDGTDAAEPVVFCDDAVFRAQDEEVYVALAAAQNAQGGAGEPATLAEDLRRASLALDRALETPPCDDELERLAADEQAAAEALSEAADQLEAGQDATDNLDSAVQTLSELENTLFRPGG